MGERDGPPAPPPASPPSATSSPPAAAQAAQLHAQQALHESVVTDIRGVLERMGLQPGTGCVVGDGLATLDLAVMVGEPPVQVAMEVVPAPGDLLASTGGGAPPMPQQHLVQSMVRRRLLQAHGWALVQVPRVEWMTLGGGDDGRRRAYLQERLSEVATGSGGGHVCGSGCSH